ncbi:phosphodiester glycosidase family protein [Streptomyces sp. NPDC000880]
MAPIRALGMHDAVNLDRGGSTAMSVEGALVNRPNGRR